MKNLIVATLALTVATSTFAKTYTCSFGKQAGGDVTGTGTLAVEFDGDTVSATGEFSTQLSGEDDYAAKLNCSGTRYTKETKAAYYKKWADYPVTPTGGCQESSIRVSKDANGNPDMSAILVIDYNGDRHDYSGYQSYFFSCKAN